jgi:hypothetical protein
MSNIKEIVQKKLDVFSIFEYQSVVPLYLDYYNIKCELKDEARIACHHPLLLRFFCEAYGNTDGREIYIGEIRDIRLKELFSVYLSRKTDQIRTSLNHHNNYIVNQYLLDLVIYMFQNSIPVIMSNEIIKATGDRDISTENSLYLRLLDEDIILAEEPGHNSDTWRISFVYEEFMEYVLARSILRDPDRIKLSNVEDIFNLLDKAQEKWINARGVGEYIALMLIEEESS